MSRFNPSFRHWNEFEWEREIRRDERRISCYFHELAGCLDLPGEDEMIFDRLLTRPGLVPANADPNHWRMWDDFEPPGDDEDESAPRLPGEELVGKLDQAACEWNVIVAYSLRENLKQEGLAVACAFGKLLSRIADYVETDIEAAFALKLSLGKRCLADINDLCRRLRALGDRQRSLRGRLQVLIEFLQHLRERVIELNTRLRRSSR